jgi:hypothetical protein
MDDYRKNPGNSLTDPSWYKKVTGMESVTIEGILTTKSDSFQIISTGHLGAMQRIIRGVVKRDSEKKLSLVAWRLG